MGPLQVTRQQAVYHNRGCSMFHRREEKREETEAEKTEDGYWAMQTVKADIDDNFVDEDTDSAEELEIIRLGTVLRKLRALVSYDAGRGYHIADRLGRIWALDTTDTPNLFRLDLHDRHVKAIMDGIGNLRRQA
jgi:hypothetical protein